MLRVDVDKWEQSGETLRESALRAEHPRPRERFMALYEIYNGTSATQVGRQTKRDPQTVMEWVHRYNESGPSAIAYQHSGGHPPLCLKTSKVVLIE